MEAKIHHFVGTLSLSRCERMHLHTKILLHMPFAPYCVFVALEELAPSATGQQMPGLGSSKWLFGLCYLKLGISTLFEKVQRACGENLKLVRLKHLCPAAPNHQLSYVRSFSSCTDRIYRWFLLEVQEEMKQNMNSRRLAEPR